jgi:hypothetical protein
MLSRLRATLQHLNLIRPRTIAQLVRAGDDTRRDVRDLARTVKQLERQLSAVSTRQDELLDLLESVRAADRTSVLAEELGAVSHKLDELGLRERQLRALQRADSRLDHRERELDAILQPEAVAAHVRAAIASATVKDDPFPHAIVDSLLPDALFDALIRGLPPAELFADRAVNKQQLAVPFEIAPSYGRRVWAFMAEQVAAGMIAPAMLDKFAPQLTAWLRMNFPVLAEQTLGEIPMTCSDGRILLRRPGYYIRPHRDPKWGFLTCLLYLKRPADDESWGTDLCRVTEDEEARGAKPHWIDEARCEVVERVAFRRNRALMFLNSTGAHTARIPEDAQPANLERYAYQFRVGAERETIQFLLANMPEERRVFWEGKVATSY